MKPTLFSVSYAGLWGQHKLNLEAFIQKSAEIGYSAVELMGKRPHLSILDFGEKQLDRIRECALSHRIEIASVAGYTDFTCGKNTPEVPFLEMQTAYIRALAQASARIGAKIVRVFTGYSTADQFCMEDWRKCVAAIRECAAITEEFGVILGVQNHHDTAISCDAYLEFLHDVDHPNCRAMFDPWAPALNGEDLYTYAKLLAPTMVQTTLADYIRLKRFAYIPDLINYRPLPEMIRAVPLGQGFIDLPSFFKGLKEGGFTGFVAYEMCSPLRGGGDEENLYKTARLSLQKIKELMA